jgi:hypothetical protein
VLLEKWWGESAVQTAILQAKKKKFRQKISPEPSLRPRTGPDLGKNGRKKNFSKKKKFFQKIFPG